MGRYFVPLVDVVGAGEENGAADHLAEYAAHRPDVNHVRVTHTEYDLRRSEIYYLLINEILEWYTKHYFCC